MSETYLVRLEQEYLTFSAAHFITFQGDTCEQLHGHNYRVWVEVEGFERVWAIADEDLEREDDVKTSAVHFLRFELTAEMAAAVKAGTRVAAGIDHAGYTHAVEAIRQGVRDSLAADLH